MTLSYDGMKNEYRMTMKGTLSHTVVLGADVFGNITRMDNLLDSFGDKLKNARAELALLDILLTIGRYTDIIIVEI